MKKKKDLFKGDENRLLVFNQPGGFLHFDIVFQPVVEHGRQLILDGGLDVIFLDLDRQIARTESGPRQRDPHLYAPDPKSTKTVKQQKKK